MAVSLHKKLNNLRNSKNTSPERVICTGVTFQSSGLWTNLFCDAVCSIFKELYVEKIKEKTEKKNEAEGLQKDK